MRTQGRETPIVSVFDERGCLRQAIGLAAAPQRVFMPRERFFVVSERALVACPEVPQLRSHFSSDAGVFRLRDSPIDPGSSRLRRPGLLMRATRGMCQCTHL
jgi:hypothetical protein